MTGSLNIRAIRAELKDESISGPSYCLLSIGDCHLHSHFDKKGGRNPEWNELFHFNLTGDEIIFTIKVYKEKHFTKKHLIAEGSTELWNLVEPHKTERWITLKQHTQVVGKILVQSEFVPLVGTNPGITLQHKESFIQAYKKRLMDMFHNMKEKPSENSGIEQTPETVVSHNKNINMVDTAIPASTVMTSKVSAQELPKSTTDTAPMIKSKDSTKTMASKPQFKENLTTRIMEAFVTKMVDKLEIHSKGTEVDKTSKVKSHSHDAKLHHHHDVHDKASSEAQKTIEAKKEGYLTSGGQTASSNINLIDFS